MSDQDEPSGASAAEVPAVEAQAALATTTVASNHEEIFAMNWFPAFIYILWARRSGERTLAGLHREADL